MRSRLGAAAVLGAWALAAWGATEARAQGKPARPNIVVILADDMGYSDLGCFGSEIRTPNIDAMAKRGVTFTQFYNQQRCCPTRAALMTGLYPHEAGIGVMIDGYAAWQRKAADSPAYQDHLSPDTPTMAEVLRSAGYHTMMAGKWHLGKEPSEWPVKRGFDRSFVQINGAMNYFGGDSKDGERAPMALDDKPFVPPHDGFYTTDAFADRAIGFLKEATTSAEKKPFFLYLPFNAPHWPLQVPDDEIKRYSGAYDKGWQAIRVQRLRKMKELGIVSEGQEMAPMDRGNAKAWDQLPEDRRKEWETRMEVYAAQIEHLDRSVGRVLAALREDGVEKDTLVVFLSDNGGAAEDPNGGDKNAPIGTRDSFRGYARPWASVSNTPWRHHKVTAYEGGTSTPMIAVWPAGIAADKEGTKIREPGHVLDFMPTFMELAGATYGGKKTLEGKSILPAIEGNPGDPNRTYCWEHEGNRAMRKGQYKIVMLASDPNWQLYDLDNDRAESHDLAASKPALLKSLAEEYDAWAKRCGVIPWPEIQKKGNGKPDPQNH